MKSEEAELIREHPPKGPFACLFSVEHAALEGQGGRGVFGSRMDTAK